MRKLLVVDDQHADLLAESYRLLGLEVITLEEWPVNWQELLTKESPDAFLLDQRMFLGPSGVEIALKLQRHPHWRNYPVIAISAHSSAIGLKWPKNVVLKIHKPFSRSDLKKSLEKIEG